MTNSPPRAAWLLVAAACWAAATNALSLPLDALALFDRSSNADCPSNFDQCSGFNLPSDFCCSSDTFCLVLAGNTTLLCCPTGHSCATISPITCDLSQQNATEHPEAAIKTTALHGTLAKCGDACCPFGYSCNSDDLCILDLNQNAVPLQTVTTTTTEETATATTATTTTTTTSSTAQTTTAHTTATVSSSSTTSATVATATTQATSTSSSTTTTTTTTTSRTGTDASESKVAHADDTSRTPTASIVGGVVGGMAGLVLVGAALWFLCSRRLRQAAGLGRRSASPGGGSRLGSGMRQRAPMDRLSDTNRLTRSTSSFGNIINNPLSISSPKPQGDVTAFRTDFIRKLPSSAGDGSRPTTPASSTVGTVGTAGTAGTAGYLLGRPAQTAASPPNLTSASRNRDLPAPPSPSPPPLALRQARDSIAVAPIRGMRTSPPATATRQHQPREPSMEEINVGVDPSIIGWGGHFSASPPSTPLPPTTTETRTRRRSADRLTTFSSLLQAANLDPAKPFVPSSVTSSPASRRR